jgi:hypothetical protein
MMWSTIRVRLGIGFVLAAALMSAGTLGVGAQRANADPVEILVSADGVTFAPTLGEHFFDGLGSIVPGDRLTTRLWVKNPSATIASLRLSARDLLIPSEAFAEAVTMTTLDTGTGRSSAASLADLAACGVIIHSTTIAPDSVLQLSMTFTMAESVDGTSAQSESADLKVVAAMREIAGGAFATTGCGDSDLVPTAGGRLSFTGGRFPTELVALGALLVGSGSFFLVARRRAREEERRS